MLLDTPKVEETNCKGKNGKLKKGQLQETIAAQREST